MVSAVTVPERAVRDRRSVSETTTLVQPDPGLTALTAREHDVLALLAQGLSNAGIAAALWISDRTVEAHVDHICKKLGVGADTRTNRRVLVVLAALGADRT